MIDEFKRRLEKMRRRVVAWAQIVEWYREEQETRLIMVGLTYREVEDYRPGHIREYVKRCKERLGEKLLAWSWVAEVQKRGAIHYHMMILVPKGTRFPMPDKSGMWKHGSSNVKTARGPWYLVSYIGKEYQKDLSRLPRGARLYATSIRFGGTEVRETYRVLSGISSEGNGGSKYRFVGAAVTKSYAENVLAKMSR